MCALLAGGERRAVREAGIEAAAEIVSDIYLITILCVELTAA